MCTGLHLQKPWLRKMHSRPAVQKIIFQPPPLFCSAGDRPALGELKLHTSIAGMLGLFGQCWATKLVCMGSSTS